MAEETKAETVEVEDARREIAGGKAVAVDVRPDDDWNEGHVPGAIRAIEGELQDSDRPDEGARLMVIAKDGKLAVQAASRLADQGFDAVAVDGGMGDWSSQNFNVQPTDDVDEDANIDLDV